MRIPTDDLLALGIVLLSIFLFFYAFGVSNSLLKILAIISSIFLFSAEIIYLYQKWFGGSKWHK